MNVFRYKFLNCLSVGLFVCCLLTADLEGHGSIRVESNTNVEEDDLTPFNVPSLL